MSDDVEQIKLNNHAVWKILNIEAKVINLEERVKKLEELKVDNREKGSFDFQWALTLIKLGKKVRRKSWGTKNYYFWLIGDELLCSFPEDNAPSFDWEDINAKDWMIYDDR